MAIVKMKRLRLLGLLRDREALLADLQRLGCLEIRQPELSGEETAWAGVTRPDLDGLTAARERQEKFTAALDTLKKYAPKKGGLLQPRPALTEGELLDQEVWRRAEKAAEDINAASRQMAAWQARLGKLATQKAALTPWLSLDVPLDTPSTRDVSVTFATIGARFDFDAVAAQVGEVSDLAQLTLAGRDRDAQYFLLVCHRSVEEAVLEVLKEYGFSKAPLRGWTGTAAENCRLLEAESANLEAKLTAARAELAAMGEYRDDLCRASDRVGQEIAREEARGSLLDTACAFLLEGWFPAERQGDLEKLLDGYVCAWEAADPAPEEYPQVPVKLRNNPFTRCLNVVTEMYSLPAYDGIDPNPLMAPFFIVFFGLMMADIGYGLLMIAGALVVLLRTRPREGTRNFMELVLWCGISTTIVGAMTGGFFGDFIPQILKIINPESTFVWFYPPLFTPLDNTVEILLGSLVVGAVQVFTGMTVSVVYKIRNGDFVDALFNEITWWIILAGGALAIFGIGSVAGVPVVLVIGALMLALGGTREAKGFGKLTSLVGLVYNGVTGFFSDILSYMRIMALMLAGSVIAQVFNTLGSAFGNVVAFVIISMIGNLLNLALNLLGCYVHDLRLQCLEYFGRFYKEGGKPFRPLDLQTKYVDILKEET